MQEYDPVAFRAKELQDTTKVLEHEVAALNKLESDEHESNAVFLHLAQIMYLEKKLIQQFLEYILGVGKSPEEVKRFLKEMKRLEEPKQRLEHALATMREYEKAMNTLSGRLQEAIDRTNLLQKAVEKHFSKKR